MNYDLKADIAVLSSLTQVDVKRLSSLCCDLICNDVLEDTETITSIDIGIGTLHIQALDGGIKYKFVPSLELDKSLIDCLKSVKSPLVNKLESSVSEVLVHSYKDLL